MRRLLQVFYRLERSYSIPQSAISGKPQRFARTDYVVYSVRPRQPVSRRLEKGRASAESVWPIRCRLPRLARLLTSLKPADVAPKTCSRCLVRRNRALGSWRLHEDRSAQTCRAMGATGMVGMYSSCSRWHVKAAISITQLWWSFDRC